MLHSGDTVKRLAAITSLTLGDTYTSTAQPLPHGESAPTPHTEGCMLPGARHSATSRLRPAAPASERPRPRPRRPAPTPSAPAPTCRAAAAQTAARDSPRPRGCGACWPCAAGHPGAAHPTGSPCPTSRPSLSAGSGGRRSRAVSVMAAPHHAPPPSPAWGNQGADGTGQRGHSWQSLGNGNRQQHKAACPRQRDSPGPTPGSQYNNYSKGSVAGYGLYLSRLSLVFVIHTMKTPIKQY